MFARLATFEGADIERATQMDEGVRDRLRAMVEGLEGWQGVLQLVDHENRNLMTLQLFDSEESMRAAESTFEDMPNEVPQVREIAARRSSVTYLEIPFGVFRGSEI